MPLKEEFNEFSPDRDQLRIECIMTRLRKVPEGEAVATYIRENNVRIDLTDNPVHLAASSLIINGIRDGIWDYEKPVIFLKRGLNDDNLLQAIVHEVGHINQHLSKVGNPDRILSETETILFYRAAEADAQALATEVTWALKQAGDAKPWNETCKVGYGDICAVYEKTVTSAPESIADGRAKRAAFDAWFDNPARVAGYNDSTVNDMIPWLTKMRGVFQNSNMQEKPLDEGWVQKLDGIGPKSYLLDPAARNLLTDDFYRGNMASRKADFANDNRKPATPAANPPRQSGPA
ncbi:MAG TPA: DUF6782 family putative metallopeptidase [Patescibacteria group bacterium]|nr:DUF6782 family putative metallopeptidase [Patescibacteria group bacterium]